MDRRSFLKATSALWGGSLLRRSSESLGFGTKDSSSDATNSGSGRSKSIIVVGGGIGGLTTGYELMKRGHEVTVLEATGEPGGHVRTLEDGLADGLYADIGAEHFTQPGYEIYRELVDELGLTKLEYPRRVNQLFLRDDGKFYESRIDRSTSALKSRGLSSREIQFLQEHPSQGLRALYFEPYLGEFEDEYQPLGIGLDHLDTVTVTELLKRQGASSAGIEIAGGSGSALQALWHDAILRLRGVPRVPTKLWRLKGGNQKLPLALAEELGRRVRLGCRVNRIEHGRSGATVTYEEFGETKTKDAGYVVISMPLPMVGGLEVEPSWSPAKQYVIENTTYYTATVFVMQSRTRFWEEDGTSPNLVFNRPELGSCRAMAGEVETPRGLIVGDAEGGTDPKETLETFRHFYPGAGENVEHIQAKSWAADRWAPFCERLSFGLGELGKFWPEVMKPEGRIHFASSSTDNLAWGMEAATRSARRVAGVIDRA